MGIQIALIADSHFDERSRFNECILLHNWIAEDIGDREVDLLLHAGDVYERRSTPAERLAVAQWLGMVTETCPAVIVRGNHDSPRDLQLLTGLDTSGPITVEEGAAVRCVETCTGVEVDIACMAWPDRASLLATLPADAGAITDDIAREHLRNVLRGMGQEMSSEGPRLFLGHCMVRGSVTSTGQPLIGTAMELGLEDLALVGADAYCLGHIHKGQQWEVNGAPVVYPGSPRRTAFGELEPKGYRLLTFEPIGDEWVLVDNEFVECPATPMLQYTGEYVSGVDDISTHEPVVIESSAEVRVRYSVSAEERVAGRNAAERLKETMIDLGASRVQLEEQVLATTRARAPEVAEAKTTQDQLRALWRSRNDIPNDETAARLFARLGQIEEVRESA